VGASLCPDHRPRRTLPKSSTDSTSNQTKIFLNSESAGSDVVLGRRQRFRSTYTGKKIGVAVLYADLYENLDYES